MKETCIFCKESEGGFSSVEHIIPESFGNDSLVLDKGIVCDKCNHGILCKLDEVFQKFEPVAFLKVNFVKKTKQNKYPIARFQNLVMKRTGEGNITITPQDKTGTMQEIMDLENGWKKWELNTRGKIFIPKKVARCLYKFSLEIVALSEGKEVALEQKYDEARNFVVNNCKIDNNLLMRTEVRPENKSKIMYQHPSFGGTIFYFNFYGFWMIINLEREPMIKAEYFPHELSFTQYPLND